MPIPKPSPAITRGKIRSPLVLFIVWSMLSLATPAMGALFISADTTIDFFIGREQNLIRIVDGPDRPTTVEIVEGADIFPHLIALENTVLNIRGGILRGVVGGADQSTVNIFGGHIGSDEQDFGMGGNGIANIYGGRFGDDISAGDSATVNLFGATFDDAEATLHVSGDGEIHVFGFGFVIDFDPPAAGSLPRLRGFFNDGSPLDVTLFSDPNADISQIVLHEIPEPSAVSLSLTALFLLLLGGRGRTLRRSPSCFARRRPTQPRSSNHATNFPDRTQEAVR